jgi:hypothetical protein
MDKSWPILYCSYMNVQSKCCCTVPADYLNLKLYQRSKRGVEGAWASFIVSSSLAITKVRREFVRKLAYRWH